MIDYGKRFLERAKVIHNDKYDYSLVEYKKNDIKVKIICPKHGIFEQRPNNHLFGQSCPKCRNLSNTEDFLEKVKILHNDKYDYSLVEYKANNIKVKIICPKHGIFEQRPNNHLVGKSCLKCSDESKILGLDKFLEKAKIVHNDKFDYSLVEYKKNNIKVKIICPKHGIFEQQPNNHLIGRGCLKCSDENKILGLDKFLEKAKIVHNDKFDYSLVDYKKSIIKVKIICPKHGIFEQMPYVHLRGKGCKKCSYENYIGVYNFTILNRDPILANTPALLYLIEHENLYKVGITIQTIQQRFHKGVNVIGYVRYTLIQAFIKEQELLEKYSKYSQKPENWKYGGDTEFMKLSKTKVRTLLSEFKTITPLWV